MKHLFYLYSCFNGSFFGELVDEAIELQKNKDNQVLFVYCGGLCEMCTQNAKGSKQLCRFCTNNTHRVLNYYHIANKALRDCVKMDQPYTFDYKTASELREITYKDVCIGLSILSSYITRTRNMNPLIDNNSKNYFDVHLNQSVWLVDALYSVVDEFKPDAIHSFNGRFEEVRPIYDICQKRGIKCYLNEGAGIKGKFKRVVFEDHLPHDIKYNKERREYCWSKYEMTQEEKIKFGESFFQKRRNGVASGDKIYIKDQEEGNIPPIDKSKINIAIFNSSEDEFVAVGGDWDLLKVFNSQFDGINYMLEHADPNMHFYLRIHPNLRDIPYHYYTDLITLDKKYSNITVIPAESKVSTYSLLDQMDKVVCFNSTMGMESVYWKVPTICLSAAMYYYDGVCYIPKNQEDVIELLRKPLKPLFNENVYKYGAWILDSSPLAVDPKNVDYTPINVKFLGLRYPIHDYLRFLVNPRITAFYLAAGRYLRGLKAFCRYEIPLKEA